MLVCCMHLVSVDIRYLVWIAYNAFESVDSMEFECPLAFLSAYLPALLVFIGQQNQFHVHTHINSNCKEDKNVFNKHENFLLFSESIYLAVFFLAFSHSIYLSSLLGCGPANGKMKSEHFIYVVVVDNFRYNHNTLFYFLYQQLCCIIFYTRICICMCG